MISVVIPCYNRSKLIKRAIDSALVQGSYANEIIVVDDGSLDDTKKICEGYGSQIKYVWQENAGASAARNTGAKLSRHPWIAFLDSDDYWTPKHLEKITTAIHATAGQANFYFCDMQLGEGKNAKTLWQKFGFVPPQPIQLANDGTNWVFLKRQPMMLQCSVFRKDAWIKSGGLDPRFRTMEDTELFFRLGIGGTICAVSGVGCIQTDDDVSDIRLTTAVASHQASYWQQALILWRILLQGFPSLELRYRMIIRHSLASAYWRLLRLGWSEGQKGHSLRYLPQILLADPGFLFALLIHRRSDVSMPLVSPEYK